ncbi:MAG: permease [bacterium]|nr:permease [bacterium]
MLTTIIMFGIAVVLTVFAYSRGVYIEGLKFSGKTFLGVLPLLIASFAVAGMVQVLIPKDIIAKWLGKEAGFKGIMIGWLIGFLIPLSPYALFPILASFYKIGASASCLVTLIAAWGMGTVSRLPLEISILGPKFVLIRVASTFILPPIAGLLAKTFFS